jgi:hypothetical protein
MKMSKWIIASATAGCGLILFAAASVLTGRFDSWLVAQTHGHPSGQFNAAGREILHLIFTWLLAFSVAGGLMAFGMAALVKWRSQRFAHVAYSTLFYWAGLMPVVAYLATFPAWALWMAVGDYLTYVK